ncbi:MAG: hypothetical protein KC635_01265 [Myxococcales bacterium]|nr:hypothetical protein [Myxococcales bacterium]MCB9734764.1 hypothetical protein [Deltaproteobacteria bacterium]
MRTAVLAAVLALAPLAACDSAGGGSHVTSGTVTFSIEQGVDFYSGQVVDHANYQNADLIGTSSGTGVKLATGGPSPTENRPVNWFLGTGGVHQTFASLAEVPTTRPDSTMTASLVKAKAGNGFVLEAHGGAYVHGWIQSADGQTVTIQFEAAPAELE